MMRPSMFAASIALWLLAGCGEAPSGPEPIPVDRVNCARCGMLVSSEAHAAQAQLPGQATRFYDDIGCLAADAQSRADGAVRYVHLAPGGWATTEAAWFARPPAARTPMDYGVMAFAAEDEAKAADRDRQARTWRAVVDFLEAR